MKTKKSLLIVFAFLLVAALVAYVTLSKSYSHYNEAKEQFKEGNYQEALDLTNKALDKDKLNRPALLLKTQINKILSSKEKYKQAEKFYKKAMRNFFEENYIDARYYISKSYGLLLSIPSNAKNIEKVNKLREKIEKDLDKIMKAYPSEIYKKALELSKSGDYIAAFEYLNNLDNNSTEAEDLKNQLAFKIGNEKYSNIISSRNDMKDYVVRDAIYWLSRVEKTSPQYQQAQKQINILKNYTNSN